MPETRKGSKGEGLSEEFMRMLLDSTKMELLTEMQKVNDSLQALQTKISNIDETLTKVLDTQKKQDLEIGALQDQVKQIKEDYAGIMNEIEDRDRRKNNLILSGFQEEEDGSVEDRRKRDIEKVDALFAQLCDFPCSVVSSVHRIGKVNSSKPRLLKIVCHNADFKRSLLRKAKDLRSLSGFENVYLNPDLTRVQQTEGKRLREELRARRSRGEEVVIMHGRIVEKSSLQNFR